jgi:hypothetical protein
MRTQFATALLALVLPIYAVQITNPSKNDVVDPSEGVEVKWTTVGTDPARANLVLVNRISGHEPFHKVIGQIDLSTGSFTVSEKDVPSDGGYQFNIESVDKLNTGILAQSEQFEVTDSDTDDEDDKKSTSTVKTVVTTSSVVRTATLTSTATFSDSTVVMTTTAVTTESPVATKTSTKGTDDDNNDDNNDDDDDDSTSTESSNGAAATGMAAGSLFALVAGVAAVMA